MNALVDPAQMKAADHPLATLVQRFALLHQRLRAEGFRVGPDSWLMVHDLLVRLSSEGRLPDDPTRLRSLLAPILCSSAEEQARFRVLFDEWSPPSTPSAPANVANDLAPGSPPDVFRRRRRRALAVLLGLGLVIAVIGFRYLTEPTATAEEQLAKSGAGSSSPAPYATTAPVDVRQVPIRKPAEMVVPPPADPVRVDRLRTALRVVPWAVTLLILVWWYRPRTVLRPERDDGGERITSSLLLAGAGEQLFTGLAASRIYEAMRRNERRPVAGIDHHRTVMRTVSYGGYFSPVRRRLSRAAPYVVLIEQRHGDDLGARLARDFVAALRLQEFEVSTYRYYNDPDHLVDESAAGVVVVTLAEVAHRHPDSRLLVMGGVQALVDPQTGKIFPKLGALAGWEQRVFLDSRPVTGQRLHVALQAAGFATGPLTLAGLEEVKFGFSDQSEIARASADLEAGAFPRQLQSAPDKWTRTALPERAARRALLAELANYLGPAGLRVLRAMAAYPAVDWSLTRAIDLMLNPTDTAVGGREVRLLHIARLPWSRAGYMPDHVRLALLRATSARERRQIREAYETLLLRLENSAAGASLGLPIGTRVPAGFKAYLRELVRFATPDSDIADPIFANVLLGGRVGLLDFEITRLAREIVPRALHRFIPGPAVLLLVACGTAAIGLEQHWSADIEPALANFLMRTGESRRAAALRSVVIRHSEATRELAQEFAAALAAFGYDAKVIQLSSLTRLDERGHNRIAYGRDLADIAADTVARLQYLSYGAPVEATPGAADGAIIFDLAAAPDGGPQAVFRDRLVAPWSVPRSQTVRDDPSVQPLPPQMVSIPGGSFVMGSPADEQDRSADEGPQHKVEVPPFLLARSEVTFEEYDRFVKATGRRSPKDRGWGRGNRPVMKVSFEDAQAYAAWLSKRVGDAFRLPSEAEWEYAARAGSAGKYWWGEEVRRGKDSEVMANCGGCGSRWDNKQTAPVGSFAANPFGLVDMHGNVWEWTTDCWHGNYDKAPTDGSAWEKEAGGDCAQRVVRGGSWFIEPAGVRSALRNRNDTDGAFDLLGFRLARTK